MADAIEALQSEVEELRASYDALRLQYEGEQVHGSAPSSPSVAPIVLPTDTNALAMIQQSGKAQIVRQSVMEVRHGDRTADL